MRRREPADLPTRAPFPSPAFSRAQVWRVVNPPADQDSGAYRVGALAGSGRQRQVWNAQALYRPAERSRLRTFLKGSGGGSVCSNELTLTECGFSNPKRSAWPLARAPGPPGAKGPGFPWPPGRGCGAGRGLQGCAVTAAGTEGHAPGRASQEGGSALGVGTRLEPRSVLAPPPRGTRALVLALFV